MPRKNIVFARQRFILVTQMKKTKTFAELNFPGRLIARDARGFFF